MTHYKLLTSGMFAKTLELGDVKTVNWSENFCGSYIWFVTSTEEHKLKGYENKVVGEYFEWAIEVIGNSVFI